MKLIPLTSVLALMLLPAFTVGQESESPVRVEVAGEPGVAPFVPIELLILEVAGGMDEEFVIDPRLRGIQAYRPSDPIDYDSLLGILRVAGLVAVEAGGQIHVMPEQNMRTAATRILQDDDRSVSDHEVVTRVIAVPSVSRTVRSPEGGSHTETLQATQLVPILRPMMSQAAQLGAVPNSNALIIVDRYDNIRRITAVIDEVVDAYED